MPVTLVGFSFGAWLAARLASTATLPNLERLALLAGYVRFRQEDVVAFEQLAGEVAAGRVSAAALVDIALARWFPSGAPGDAAAHVGELVTSLSRDRLVRSLQRLNGSGRADRMAGSCSLPTAVIHGRGDAAVPLAAGEQLTALLPHASLTVLDTDSHYIPWTRTDACVAAICGL
jgi:pimeloyl-ACP methyl ester carboxylesterase